MKMVEKNCYNPHRSGNVSLINVPHIIVIGKHHETWTNWVSLRNPPHCRIPKLDKNTKHGKKLNVISRIFY